MSQKSCSWLFIIFCIVPGGLNSWKAFFHDNHINFTYKGNKHYYFIIKFNFNTKISVDISIKSRPRIIRYLPQIGMRTFNPNYIWVKYYLNEGGVGSMPCHCIARLIITLHYHLYQYCTAIFQLTVRSVTSTAARGSFKFDTR